MALYEFYCDPCRHKFEEIVRSGDSNAGQCPKCQGKNTRKLISRFAVGGQGDLRESTMHGCHDAHVSPGGGSEPAAADTGHVHSAGCGHGGGGHSHSE